MYAYYINVFLLQLFQATSGFFHFSFSIIKSMTSSRSVLWYTSTSAVNIIAKTIKLVSDFVKLIIRERRVHEQGVHTFREGVHRGCTKRGVHGGCTKEGLCEHSEHLPGYGSDGHAILT